MIANLCYSIFNAQHPCASSRRWPPAQQVPLEPYICIYMYIYVCIYMYIYIPNIHMYVYMYADVCWRMLTYAHVCSRMLTYADVAHVCWRMLTYADVCWRYADVCWRTYADGRCRRRRKWRSSATLWASPHAHVCSRMLTYAHVSIRRSFCVYRVLMRLTGSKLESTHHSCSTFLSVGNLLSVTQRAVNHTDSSEGKRKISSCYHALSSSVTFKTAKPPSTKP